VIRLKWEKVAERENDFLKNCLVYEAFIEDFPRVFDRKHPDFLTIRKGMSYTHYINEESATDLAIFILEKTKIDSGYLDGMFDFAKKHFGNLIDFSLNIPKLENKSNTELLRLLEEYFELYKRSYPYFLITVEARVFEKENTPIAESMINKMAKLRLFGRTSFNKTHELIYPLFDEIATRFDITVKELKFLSPKEVMRLLNGENIDVSLLNKDRDRCVFIHTQGKYELHENATLIIHDDEDGVDANEITGQGTYPALYKGRVKLVRNIDDMNSLEGGEVIVLQMTTADMVVAGIKKAGAIITDEGGITCHAAIISRELKIPALIGTKIATKRLNDGDFVEVDAVNGKVRILEK
jgi:phosphohistidine swiveling domain-containing protein